MNVDIAILKDIWADLEIYNRRLTDNYIDHFGDAMRKLEALIESEEPEYFEDV